MTDVKNIISNFWSTNSALIIKIAVGIVVVVLLIIGGWWYASKAVNKLAADLRAQAIADNRPMYDNLVLLKDRTKTLELQYGTQRSELDVLRRKQKGGATNAFNNPDKKVAASYFDNAVDSYIPSN